MPSIRVIVTRPAREAVRWVGDLRAAGIDAVALPLIEIAPLQDPAPVNAAWQRLSRYRALMFVSAAAVEHFFKQKEAVVPATSAQEAIDLIANQRCWATGPGTAAALRSVGLPDDRIDTPPPGAAQFDSEALWTVVRPQLQPGAGVLIVRGGDADGRPTGRDWLAREIAAAGGICETVVAYRRLPPKLGEAERQLAADAAHAPAVWLFSSSEAVVHLRQALPATSWRSACAVATHPRIAQAVNEAGFGTVVSSRPVLEAVVASIESLR